MTADPPNAAPEVQVPATMSRERQARGRSWVLPALAAANLLLILIGLAYWHVVLGGRSAGDGVPSRLYEFLIGSCSLALAAWICIRAASAIPSARRSTLEGHPARRAPSDGILSAILEAAVDGLVIIDEKGQVELFNGAAERIFGYSRDEVIGSNVSMLMPEPNASKHDGYLRKFRDRDTSNVVGFELEVEAKRKDGSVFPMSLAMCATRSAGRLCIAGFMRDLTYEKSKQAKINLQAAALSAAADGIVITDRRGVIRWVNPAFCTLSGYSPEEVLGKPTSILKSGQHDADLYRGLWKTVTAGDVWSGEITNRRKDGSLYVEEMTITPVPGDGGQIESFVAIKRDVTERNKVAKERKLLERQLVQAQRLESVGQLAAGIAHEINTPTQYVGDNTRFLQEAFSELLPILLSAADVVQAQDVKGAATDSLKDLKTALEAADCEYLREEVPRAIQQSLDGIERVSTIVKAMKEFSHPGVAEMTKIDLNHALESTTIVARNEWKYVAEVEFELTPDLPAVSCLPGEFNQVILNLVVNAAHAIADVVGDGSEGKGTITVSTRLVGDHVEVLVRDTGAGIPESARPKIFEPFFTTKGVGRGTGQGLAIAHDVIVNKHGGTIDFETWLGQGTVFKIRLPLTQQDSPEKLTAA